MHLAAESGDTAAVKALLDIGMDVDTETENGWTPLHFAARGGHTAVMMVLLAVGVDAGNETANGEAPLDFAVQEGHTDVIKYLFEKILVNASVHIDEIPELTLWNIAALKRHADMDALVKDGVVDALVKIGENPNAGNMKGMTLLHLAAWNGHATMFLALLKAGADMNVMIPVSGETPLETAKKRGHLAALINAKDKDGQTPLYLAMQREDSAVIAALFSAGVDLKATNKDGWTCLHIAVHEGHVAVIDALIGAGVDLDVKTPANGWTPLHIAAQEGNVAMIKALIKAKANIDATDSDGKTPSDIAAKNGYGTAFVEAVVAALR